MSKDIQSSDFQWFLKNYADLFEKYGNTYLAIKNNAVIGTYNSYAEAVKSTSSREELGTFIVQECNGDESAYTNYILSMNFA